MTSARRLGMSLPLMLAVLIMVAGAPRDASASSVRQCGVVSVGSQKEPVWARKLSCKKARRLARSFRTGELPSGWVGQNPAGCEWIFIPRGQEKDILTRARFGVTRQRECNS